ncbi:MAG: histidine kinase [Chitinophagaceae bacterium]|nr:histidine kinase [Chitinophagaceae bacterium]
MKLKLPQYSGKDYVVLILFIVPFTVAMNGVIFGHAYFSKWTMFVLATVITGIAFAIDFVLCGSVAVLLKKRFPLESQVSVRFSFMIVAFIIITGLFLLLLFRGYETIDFYGYTFNEKGFIWAYVCMGIANIFLTFLHEGIARYRDWSLNLRETEELRKAYKQSQLQGLKSQVNPHFLFNSLNSLSSLISEDEDRAEKFLDEMSKVYRYMLRTDDEQMVTLGTELKFIESYIHVLKARYGDGLEVKVSVNDADKQLMMPPLTLQILVENAFSQNMISKSSPLKICIASDDGRSVIVRNNIQPKVVTETMDFEAELDNLIRKYQLLNKPLVVADDGATQRTIRLPLIERKEEAAA